MLSMKLNTRIPVQTCLSTLYGKYNSILQIAHSLGCHKLFSNHVTLYVAVFVNWETSNRYAIKNSLGQQVFFAAEESDTCHRQCCGPGRGFVMHITDNLGQVGLVRD